MTFDYYKIINKGDFEASGLVSKELDLFLDGIGQKKILVTRGNLYSIILDGVMLSIGLNGSNPFIVGSYSVYLGSNDDIYLGVSTTNED